MLNLSLLCQSQQHYSICALKFILHTICFFCIFFFPTANSLHVAHGVFAFCRARLTNQHWTLLPAILSSSLTWSCLLLADFRVCKITSTLQKIIFYKKKKENLYLLAPMRQTTLSATVLCFHVNPVLWTAQGLETLQLPNSWLSCQKLGNPGIWLVCTPGSIMFLS